MDFNGFVLHRQPRWKRLSEIVERVDKRGLATLSPAEVDDFFSLYRLVSSDLSLVQTRTANPAVVDYLEALVARAYSNIATPSGRGFFRSWWMILRHYFPAAVRRERKLVAAGVAVYVVAAAAAFCGTLARPRIARYFLSASVAYSNPTARVHRLIAMEQKGHTRVGSFRTQSVFSAFLMTHNLSVCVLCFALGLTLGIGTVAALIFNAGMLGALAALYWKGGVMLFFVAWITPHGSMEIPATIFSAVAGLLLARAQWHRTGGPVFQQIRQAWPEIADILVGVACMLVIAGCIEGGFSQINPPTIPYVVKIGVAVALTSLLWAYLVVMPVQERPKVRDAAATMDVRLADDAPIRTAPAVI